MFTLVSSSDPEGAELQPHPGAVCLLETPLRTLHPRRIQHGIPLGFSLILVFSSSLANVNAIRSTAFAIAPAATATRHKRPLSRSCCQHKE